MNSSGTLLRTRPTRLAALVYLISALTLSRVPLFNYLGCEFSAAIGVVAGLLAGLLTISFFRRSISPGALSKSEFTSLTSRSFVINALLLLLPLAIISINALFVKNCSFVNGFVFFLLIPFVTIVFAVVLGASTAVWFHRPVPWYLIFFLLILLHPIYLTLTSPQLFAYNFLFGYFPGFTYDEVLRITTPVLLCRALTLVAAVALLSFTIIAIESSSPSGTFFAKLKSLRHLFRVRAETLVAVVGLVLVIASCVFHNELGFESSASYIQHELGSKYITPHFYIYYSPRQIPEDRIKWIAAEHEFHYVQVSRILRVDFRGRIDSYIYPSPEVKKKFIGTSTTNIAKPWRREIHLSLESFESSFRHELVHVLAGEFGMPILRISPSPGLIEGLAVAVDWNAGDRTPHEFAAALFRFGLVRNISGIFSFTGFAAKPSSVSYLLSGSFTRFLIEEYGMRRFAALYQFGQFEKIYKKSLGDLIEEWEDFLQYVDMPPSDEARARLLFARPSIFSKICARTIAELNESAARLLNEKKYVEASSAFQSSYAMSRSREAMLGIIAANFHLGKYDSVIAGITHALEDSLTASGYLPLKLTLGDCYWILGEQDHAGALYKELRWLDIGELYNEASAVRLESIRQPKIESFMKRYLATAGDDTMRVIVLSQLLSETPDNPIGLYLIGKISFRQGKYKEAFDFHSKIKKRFQDPILNFQLERTLGLSLFHLKNFQEAKIHLWQSLNYTKNKGEMNQMDDLIEFCDWLDRHRDLIE